ncbi:MAG: hypothetical protein JW874_06995 [Spirochaetales bacterium]|nr:hypothetical protein [Spirochaetales bacterium]
MDKEHGKGRPSHKFLIGGIFFILIGISLLLWTTGYLSLLGSILPALVTCFGVFLLYMVFVRGTSDIYIIPATLVILLGIFLWIRKRVLPNEGLDKIWPLFMTAAGVSLLLFAFRVKGGRRIKLLVPSLSLVLLSFLFLPFSLGAVRISFSEFVVTWWPVLILILGIGSIILYFRNKKSGNDSDENEDNEGE